MRILFLVVSTLFLTLVSPLGAKEVSFERRSPVVVAVEKVGPAVANISTERLVAQRHVDPFFMGRSELFREFFESFFGPITEKKVETPLGSGVIIDPEGYIVTNEHVISSASKIIVTLSHGPVYEAHLVSSDPESDLAVLKVDSPQTLPYVEMGISHDLMIGETVIALGNPFGFKNSITTGVLSATDRTLTFEGKYGEVKYEGLIQTDALINPGNSGGPLVNINGELIGINTAIVSQAQGIGFAIPVDKVKETLVKLFNFQEINKVWLGAVVEELSQAGHGVKVKTVEKDSPAAKAGLQEGDVVLELDSRKIHDVLEFEKYLLKKEARDSLDIKLERKGKEKVVHLTLEKVPAPPVEKLAGERLGIGVQELGKELAESLDLWWLKGGVLITEVERGGPAGQEGIEPGYVIISLGEYKISSLEELGTLLSRIETGKLVDIGLAWSDRLGAHRGYARLRTR